MQLARVDLQGTLWAEAVERRLAEFGDPLPPIKDRKAAKTFTYADTLEWGEPAAVEGGLLWRKPRAVISLVFVPPSSRELSAVLKELKETGAPEDAHMLTEVRISSRSAYSGRYTTYVYPEPALLGSAVKVYKTQAYVVPVESGYYKAQYRAEAAEFERHREAFEKFLRYVDFAPPPPKEKKS